MRTNYINKILLFLGLIFSIESYALKPHEANYNLDYVTNISAIKIGNANFKFEVNDTKYVYIEKAITSPLWKIVYDYSRDEKSSGIVVDQQFINHYYKMLELTKGSAAKDLEINIFADQGYSIINGDKFLKIGSGRIVDELSIYLMLSQDMKAQPDKDSFTYEIANSKGIKTQVFKHLGNEIIEINGKKMQTIKVYCEEIKLTIHFSKAHDYLPVLIKKISDHGKEFRLTITSYAETL